MLILKHMKTFFGNHSNVVSDPLRHIKLDSTPRGWSTVWMHLAWVRLRRILTFTSNLSPATW